MVALLLLVCWLVCCAFVPLVLWVTRHDPVEVRVVTNALVLHRAASEPAVLTIRDTPELRERMVTLRTSRASISAPVGSALGAIISAESVS